MGRALQTPPTHRASRKHRAASPLTRRVIQEIRDRILSWRYPPGRHLGERELCEEFSASRIPVREALNTLAEQGLVDRVPNQGCYVRQPNLRDVHELYDLRLALELFVIERLSRAGLPAAWESEQRAHWERLLDIRADAVVRSEELVRADEAFHLGLARALDNAHIAEALEAVLDRIRFVRMAVPTTPHRVQATAGEHLEIMAAIGRKDTEGARRALWRNVNEARNKVESALTQALAGAVWPKHTPAIRHSA